MRQQPNSVDANVNAIHSNDSNRAGYFFIAESTEGFDCCNFTTIWFLKATLKLSFFHKQTFTKSLSRIRNLSITLYFFQLIIDIINIGINFQKRNAGFLITIFIVCLGVIIGLIGAIRSNAYLLTAAFGVHFITFVMFIIFVAISIALSENDGLVFAVYSLIFVELALFVFQTYFTWSFIRWHDKAEKAKKLRERQRAGRPPISAQRAIFSDDRSVGNQPQSVNQNRLPLPSANAQENGRNLSSNNRNSGLVQVQSGNLQAPQNVNLEKNSSHNIDLEVNSRGLGGEEDVEISKATCIICYANKQEVAFYKCGHLCCCQKCGNRFKGSRCPVCRQQVLDVIKLFAAGSE